MNLDMTGKVVLITGAASGIGKKLALVFARAGANVVAADLNYAGVQETSAEATAMGCSGKALGVEMDVTSQESVNKGFADAVQAFGEVDVLISNAGVQIVAPIDEYSFEDWKKMMAIHLDGAFLTTQAAVKGMKRAGRGGVVIYMGSVHSHEPSPLKSAYVTAKHGLLGLSRVLAVEGAKDHITSHVICPGFVKTPLVEKQLPEQAAALGISEKEVVRQLMLSQTVDGEFTTTQEVADLALFLAAGPSAALTGQSFLLTHGWAKR